MDEIYYVVADEEVKEGNDLMSLVVNEGAYFKGDELERAIEDVEEYEHPRPKLWKLVLHAEEVDLSKMHKQHPVGDHCVYCGAQWPCEESKQ